MSKIQKKILEALSESNYGLTIKNLMDVTKFSRGAVKMNLLYLMLDKKVKEIPYTKNTKVYMILR
jgi:hypothetical protein